MVNLRWAACLIGAVSVAIGTSACGGGPSVNAGPASPRAPAATGTPTVSVPGYLEATAGYVLFLTFSSQTGATDGQLNTAGADAVAVSGLAGKAVHFTGEFNGSNVAIDINGVRWAGQTTSTGMTFLIPDSSGRLVSHAFSKATSNDYNAAVSKLGVAVTGTRAAATVSASGEARRLADAQTATAASATADTRRRVAAQATATAQRQVQINEAKQQSCAAIGGHVATKADTAIPEGWCASNTQGSPIGKVGADCAFASTTFTVDGTIDKGHLSTTKIFYPGCFN